MVVFVDAGYSTYEVYSNCAEHGWTALMGDKRNTFTHRTSNGQTIERFYLPKRSINLGYAKGRQSFCDMYFWSNLNVREALFRLLKNVTAPLWEVLYNSPTE